MPGKGNSRKEILSLPKPTTDSIAHWMRTREDCEEALFVNFHRLHKIGGTGHSSTSLYRMVRVGEKDELDRGSLRIGPCYHQ